MDEELILEQEIDTPENWIPNTILVRDGKGNIIEIEMPENEEG